MPARCSALALVLVLAAGCTIFGAPQEQLPVITVAGADPSHRALVVVLPGFAYDADDLRDKGVAAAIQRGWPAADVALTGATFPYYRTGVLVQRLHDQVIAPARAQGYREIWLTGGSMGGMGALLYERTHPGELTGVVLMSPFLGRGGLLDEIRKAGLDAWDPGPLPPEMNRDNYQRQVWAMIHGWRDHPELARRAWLACGTDDHLYGDVQVLRPRILPAHYLERPGGHDWKFWLPAVEEVMRRIAAEPR